MARRRSQQDMIGWILFAFMAFVSGVLLWAIVGGVAVAAVFYFVSRERRWAFDAGFITIVLITAFGVASMLSPGWYQGLL